LKPLDDVFGDELPDWLSRVGFVIKVVQGDCQESLPLVSAVGVGAPQYVGILLVHCVKFQ
jgi:hypothetical protein